MVLIVYIGFARQKVGASTGFGWPSIGAEIGFSGLVGLESIGSALSSARSILYLRVTTSGWIYWYCTSEEKARCGESYLILKQMLTLDENGACHRGRWPKPPNEPRTLKRLRRPSPVYPYKFNPQKFPQTNTWYKQELIKWIILRKPN